VSIEGCVAPQCARLTGEGTQLRVAGSIGLNTDKIDVQASGDANLGILQGFYRNLRSRGTATLKAQVTGPLDRPVFAGSATIVDGRLRHFSLPHSLEAINGNLSFDAAGVRVDEVKGRLGQGTVTFGGRIGLNGFAVGDLSLTALGERMTVRYPEGFRSVIDADLRLLGTLASSVLSGSVVVHDAVWSKRIEANPDLFNFSGTGGGGLGASGTAQTLPLRLDVDILAPSSLRIENNIASMRASADVKLQGTYDRPLLFGRAEIERGNVLFEGNRYVVTPGGSIEFYNPQRIEPFFDVEAETRVRVPGQEYRVTVGLSGTANRLAPSLNSDPPLPQVDIIALLFGQTVDVSDAELRALRPGAAQQSEEALVRQGMARLLASPISTPVGRALGEAFGIDQVTITPTLGTGSETDPLSPSARVVIGKRISNRAYLTFARALGNSRSQGDQVLVLEYDQNDRLGWVLTQNGDGTFALDFRVRHRF
jgi:translocation and assembly module TamB